jgi:hypothetical protein
MVPANLEELSRKELQQLCKQLGIKANSKTAVLVEELQAYTADTEPDQEAEPAEQEAAAEKEAEELAAKETEALAAKATEELAEKEAVDVAEAEAEAEIQAQMEAKAKAAQRASELQAEKEAEEQAEKEAVEQAEKEALEAEAEAQRAAELQAEKEAEELANQEADELAAEAEIRAAEAEIEAADAELALKEQAEAEATAQELEASMETNAALEQAQQEETDEMETAGSGEDGDAMDTEEMELSDSESFEDKQGRLYENAMDELKVSMKARLQHKNNQPEEAKEEVAVPEVSVQDVAVQQVTVQEVAVQEVEEQPEKSEAMSAVEKAQAFLAKMGGTPKTASTGIPKPRLSGGSGAGSRAKQIQEQKKQQRKQQTRGAADKKSNLRMKGTVKKGAARPTSAFESKSAKKAKKAVRVKFDECHEKLFDKGPSIMDMYKRRQQTPKKPVTATAKASSTKKSTAFEFKAPSTSKVPKLSFESVADEPAKEPPKKTAAERAQAKRDQMARKARQAQAKKVAEAKVKKEAEVKAKKEAEVKALAKSKAKKKLIGKNGAYEVKVGALAKFRDTSQKKDTPVKKTKPKKFDLAASLANAKGKKLGYKPYSGTVATKTKKSTLSKENVATASNPKAGVSVKQRTKPAMKDARRSQFASETKRKGTVARSKARATPSKAPSHVGGALQTAK